MSKYIQPSIGQRSFHCPNCEVLSEQTWSENISCSYSYIPPHGGQPQHTNFKLKDFVVSKCSNCNRFSIWLNQKMVYPMTGNVELANEDLPENIKEDYNEAKNIVNISPKGASALLRLALQKLCIFLEEKGKNINDDIASLVKKGLPIHIQQALDIIRVTGNHAVHPGIIDDIDKTENALALFGLINFISNHFITQPKIIAGFYNNLPEKDRKNIEKRDNK